MLDYSKQIPTEYREECAHKGKLVLEKYKGKTIDVYIPYGYSPEKMYPIFYFKMGWGNTAKQFFTYEGYTSHFEYVLDNLIDREEIEPCIVVSIDGETKGSWLPENAYGLICFVEGKLTTYACRDANKIIESAPHRAVGGWSYGAIECRTMLVNERNNDFWRYFGWYDIQSGYNSSGMNSISGIPFVGCVAGSNDDPKCVRFTADCAKFFMEKEKLKKDHAQIVSGCRHAINFQVRYFYNAIRYFFQKQN